MNINKKRLFSASHPFSLPRFPSLLTIRKENITFRDTIITDSSGLCFPFTHSLDFIPVTKDRRYESYI